MMKEHNTMKKRRIHIESLEMENKVISLKIIQKMG